VSDTNREFEGSGVYNNLYKQSGVIADGAFIQKVDLDDYVDPTVNKSRVFTNNQITFNIAKSLKPPNKGVITVFNISKELSNYLAENQANDIVVQLKAGYEDTNLETLFKGTLTFFEEDFSSETKKTKLHVTDGGVNIKEGNTLRAWPTGTPVDSIVESLLDDIGLPKAQGGIAKLGADVTVESPLYLTGSIMRGIQRLAEEYKFVFSVQDGASFWMPPEARSEVVAFNINSETGLKGSPQPINKAASSKQGDVKVRQTSLRVKTLLNGVINPESTVYVKSEFYDNAIKVTKVTHTGSYEGGNWETLIEGDIVDAVVNQTAVFGGNR